MFYDGIRPIAIKYPERVAILPIGGSALTYRALWQSVTYAIEYFNKQGLKPGDVVFVRRSDPIMLIVDLMAMWHIGCITLAFPPSINSWQKVVDRIRPQFLQTDSFLTKLEEYHGDARLCKEDDVLSFTSGSNGPQKVVIRPILNLMDEALGVGKHLGLDNLSRVCVMTPLEHSFGCGVWRATLIAGATLVVPTAATLTRKLDQIRKAAISVDFLFGVPFLFHMLAKENFRVSRGARAFAGGEVLPTNMADEWQKRTGTILQQEYGLSEGGITLMANPDTKSYSLGSPIPGVTAELIDVNPITRVGELVVYRNYAPKAYLLEGAAETFLPDGGIRTGDLMWSSKGMYEPVEYHFVRRIKSIIVVAGLKVTPNEIEQEIREAGGVEDVVVLPERNQLTGERPVAFIVLSPSVHSVEHIHHHLRTTLEPYKVPHRFVILEELPRTDSGKVDREALLDKV
jgi:long-chain acyl-CoA synthetase